MTFHKSRKYAAVAKDIVLREQIKIKAKKQPISPPVDENNLSEVDNYGGCILS